MRNQWSRWHTESIAQLQAQDYQGINFDMASVNSDCTIPYDIDADMVLDHDIVECESVQSMNDVPELSDINQVGAELNVRQP